MLKCRQNWRRVAIFRQFSGYKMLEFTQKCQKIFSIGSLTFAKDLKTAKIFVSMLHFSKNFNFQDFAVIL